MKQKKCPSKAELSRRQQRQNEKACREAHIDYLEMVREISSQIDHAYTEKRRHEELCMLHGKLSALYSERARHLCDKRCEMHANHLKPKGKKHGKA